jgi:hypothetical protein
VRRSLAAALLAAALLPGAAAGQGAPAFAVSHAGPAGGWRAVLSVEGVLSDRRLLEALAGGLPLRFELRTELWRKAEPFDRLEGAHVVHRALLRSALDEGYVVEDGRLRRGYATLDAAAAALRAAFSPPLRPDGSGRYYYLARLDVQTLSTSDLEELRLWLRGEAAPAVAGERPLGRAVGEGVRRLFVRLLRLPARRYEARSGIFRVGGGG